MISQKELKEVLDYDPDTGMFRRKKSKRIDSVGKETGKCATSWGYRVIKLNGKVEKCHRRAFLWMTGSIPSNIAHINNDRSDNRWINLRAVDNAQNTHNSKIRKDNASGVKGVSWCKTNKRWRAVIQSYGKIITIGYFPDLIGAELAVRKARTDLHGEFANHG